MSLTKKQRKVADRLSKDAANRVVDFIKETNRVGVGIAYLSLAEEMRSSMRMLKAKDVMDAAVMLGEDIKGAIVALDEMK